MPRLPLPAEAESLTVSELTARIKLLLESHFARVTVLGEISNCRPASSGHVYLTLKDDGAQIPAVIWRSRAARIRFDLHNGLEVVATGAVEIYAPHGKYQLIIDGVVPQGIGSLELAFRQLQEKLAAEALFAPERKRPLPRFPRRIALVTSPTGAAVRDMLQVITRRWKGADVVILPVRVQGDGAAGEIAAALQLVPEVPDVDVVVTGRGGGSLEDLWAFNEEVVARAIFACPIPVVSAVGHEIDVSIADLVADRRALTPSEAGELVVPDRVEVRAHIDRLRHRLISALRLHAREARSRLDGLAERRIFTRPLDALHDRTERVDELSDRMQRAAALLLERRKQKLAAVAGSLDALSPFKVLQRGYSVTTRSNGIAVRSVDDLAVGEPVVTLLADGRFTSRVNSVDRTHRIPALPADGAAPSLPTSHDGKDVSPR
jgi:exodeoxyribonuclease VII large subunit